MNRILLLLAAFAMALGAGAQTFKLDTLVYNGSTDNRINMLILGDGYRLEDSTKFRSDARSDMNYFFSKPPFNYYRKFFNFFAVEVVSNEAGTNHPATATDEPTNPAQPVAVVDNYLETTFDIGGTHRCVFSSDLGKVFTVANNNFPQYDLLNVIINSTYYGGCGGPVSFMTMHSSAPEIFVHEFGHTFAQLADEYDYGNTNCSPGNQQQYNVSQVTDTARLLWKKWLTTATVPTPANTNCSGVGVYEGAQYCTTNWYRPKCNCRMRALNNIFCEVCVERFISVMDSMVNFIDDAAPSGNQVAVGQGQTRRFSITPVRTAPNSIIPTWYVDNQVASTGDSFFVYNPALYAAGSHQVRVTCRDTTKLVRLGLTSYSRSWTVSQSSTSVAEQPAPVPAWTVSPNPFSRTVELSATHWKAGRYHLSVTDLLGKVQQERELEIGAGAWHETFDLSSLVPGVYTLRISGEGMTVSEKIVRK